MLAKPQGFPRKLGGCAGLDPRLRSAVSAGVGDGERGLRRGLRAPGVGVRPKWVLEYSPSNKRIRYFVSITYVRTGLWTAHKFCGGGDSFDVCLSPVVPSGINPRAHKRGQGILELRGHLLNPLDQQCHEPLGTGIVHAQGPLCVSGSFTTEEPDRVQQFSGSIQPRTKGEPCADDQHDKETDSNPAADQNVPASACHVSKSYVKPVECPVWIKAARLESELAEMWRSGSVRSELTNSQVRRYLT